MYGLVERALANAFFAKKSLPEEEAGQLVGKFREISGAEDSDSVTTVLGRVSMTLESYDMKLVTMRDQTTGERIYVMVNTAPSAAAEKATSFDANELAIFREVIRVAFLADLNSPQDRFWITPEDFGLMDNDVRKRHTQSYINRVITRLVDRGWLNSYESNRVGPSIRTLAELSDYIRDMASDDATVYRQCAGCQNIFTVGWQCSTDKCPIRVHKHCANSYFRAFGGRKECGLCHANFDETHALKVDPGLETALDDNSATEPAVRGSRASRVGNGRRSPEDDEDGDGNASNTNDNDDQDEEGSEGGERSETEAMERDTKQEPQD